MAEPLPEAPAGLDPALWQEALESHGQRPGPAAADLHERGLIAETAYAELRARQLGWDHESDPDLSTLDTELAQTLGFGLVRRLGTLPARQEEEGSLVVWTRPDVGLEALLEIQGHWGPDLHPVVLPEEAFNRAVQRAFERGGAASDAMEELDGTVDLEAISGGLPESADLLESEDDAPLIRLLNAVLTQAIEDGASDIHVEPYESRLVIRERVDGVLRDMLEPPRASAPRLVSRIKVMARLDIAERRIPQDGRIGVRLAGRTIDLRVSTLPTQYGERVVMRILEKEQGPMTLEALGMPEDVRSSYERLIQSPHGILLVTGPTGSGKSTSLYAGLQAIRSPALNIITIEDPVEYDLEGVGQIPVNNKMGMTFARGLRSILRQDPDVIMVGEIRDLETAEVAVQASLTGHLVFSTLHTNDAVGSVTRLVDMGVEPYLVASSLLGSMAQRLVRRLCQDCKEPVEADDGQKALLGLGGEEPVTIHEPHGCPSCGFSGYRGRTGLYELLVLDDELRHLVHDNAGEEAIRQQARNNGTRFLREDGARKVLAGATSLEEVLRVTRGH